MEEHQGQYPVIYITFKELTKNNFFSFLDQFRIIINILFKEHKYLLKKLDKFDQEDFEKFSSMKTIFKASQTELENSIFLLSRLLYNHHNNHRSH